MRSNRMIGRTLHHYHIVDKIGEGGMGEVYKARDTRLDRTVALKILPRHLTDNAELRQRFEREARAIASLSHPHICVLYDVGQNEGIDFLVMEYLEGETLAERLARGPLPLDQVLRYAKEMADALDKAHRHGVVHRDLKPGNVILTKAGVKLLDFGLAKLRPAASAGEKGLSAGLTPQQPLTRTGDIFGTPQYMAPEQLEGKEADARTDLFALGAVVYEMATGRKAFEGKSPASLIAAILEHDPLPMSTLQREAPRGLDRILRSCLKKDPDERWQTARDLSLELEWLAEEAPAAPAVARRARGRFAWSLAAVLLVGLVASLPSWIRARHSETVSAVRFSVSPPEGAIFTSTETAGVTPQIAVSPDGRYLVFVASAGDGRPVLWVRPLGSLDAQPLPGTDDASFPFWSPDSRFIGFFVPGKLKKVEASGGLPQPVADVPTGRGGTWNRDGIILFATNISGGLYRVQDSGGPIAAVTTLDAARQETAHRWPQFLPDGRHFLYFVRAGSDVQGVYVGSLDSPEKTRLLGGNVRGAAAAAGYLLSVHDGSLMAQRFSARDRQLSGEPILLAEGVASGSPTGLAALSASETGVFAYASGITPNRELVWFDRGGRSLGVVGERGEYSNPSLSPDEKTLAVQRIAGQTRTPDIWLLDLVRGVRTRFTFDTAPDRGPVWSPDGGRIAFASSRAGPWDLYQKASSGAGSDELLSSSGEDKFPTDWSPDGRFIVYHTPGKTGWDLWVSPVSGDGRPTAFLQTEFTEVLGAVSPDGRWMAYTSDESGAFEVYVRPFPVTGGKWQVSTHGGSEPKWRPDGREIYYIAPDKSLMAVAISTGPGFESGVPKALFEARVPGVTLPFPRTYVVAERGQRFLLNTIVERATSSPITVVLNWTAEQRQ